MTYLRIGALLVFMAVIAGLLWYRGEAISAAAERDRARADLQVAVDANAAQQATIGRLRADAEANDRLLADMAAQIAIITSKVTETNAALSDLKETNADVRDYLSTPVPPDLDRLLNR